MSNQEKARIRLGYRAIILQVVKEIEERYAQARRRRFEKAHNEWRVLVGLKPL